MGHLLIPYASVFIALGITNDLIYYSNMQSYREKSIFNKDDFVQTRKEVLDAAYHVFPGDEFPTSVFGFPIDLVLNYKYNPIKYVPWFSVPSPFLSRNVDSVTIAVVAKYITAERSLKKDATPVPGWQRDIPKSRTHYVDKLYLGGSCHGMFSVKSNVTGDAQILRKIITDIMGSSGQVTKDTLDLWKRARKAIEESKDLRGKVTVSPGIYSFTEIQETSGEIESFLEYVPTLSQFVILDSSNTTARPIAASYKELHDLDEQYPALNKNSETETYLEKLNYRIEDLKSTDDLAVSLYGKTSTNLLKIIEFQKKAQNNLKTLESLASGNFSIYKEITNKDAFKSAFHQYESGLDRNASSYYMTLKRNSEKEGFRCKNEFLKPTSGYLQVAKNEVITKTFSHGNITLCQELCETDYRCRSFAYLDPDSSHRTLFSGKGQLCSIFYRSTNTATLIYLKDILGGLQVYDRKCE